MTLELKINPVNSIVDRRVKPAYRRRTRNKYDYSALAICGIFWSDFNEVLESYAAEVEGTGGVDGKGEVPSVEWMGFTILVNDLGSRSNASAVDDPA